MQNLSFDTYAYARQVLLPSLGLQNHPFVIHRQKGGTASHVVKVAIERAPPLLVRFFKGRDRARRCALALQHLERRNLPAPRLRLADTGLANPLLRRNGLPRYATAETWIEGVLAVEAMGEEVTLMVADVLARYHAVSRSRWGRPEGLPEVRPYHTVTLALAARMIRDLVTRGVLEIEESELALARFASWKSSLMKLGTFHLVHNDANRANFIVAGKGKQREVIPIDVHRISYEPCAEEVANAIFHFSRDDPKLAGRFLEAYLDAATPSCRITWERTGAFFTSLNMVKRLHRRTGFDPGQQPLDGTDPRIDEWKSAILGLPPPPRIWPEPGSSPPES